MEVSYLDLAAEHLLLRLQPLNRTLAQAVKWQRKQAAQLQRPEITPLCVTDEQINLLLRNVMALGGTAEWNGPCKPTRDEVELQTRLRNCVHAVHGKLPMDRLQETLLLGDIEMDCLLLCAAPELHRDYERIFAYIHDDLNRRFPSVELLSSLLASSFQEGLARRRLIGPFGTLRRMGLIEEFGEKQPTDLRQELRLAPGLFQFLTGIAGIDFGRFRDADVIDTSDNAPLPPGLEPKAISQATGALASGKISVLGLWGPQHSPVPDVVRAISHAANRRLRRWHIENPGDSVEQLRRLEAALLLASASSSWLWVHIDSPLHHGDNGLLEAISERLAFSEVTLFISSAMPWRPKTLLEKRAYAELELQTPTTDHRSSLWLKSVPELDPGYAESLAAQFKLGGADIQTAARFARNQITALPQPSSNGTALRSNLEKACANISRPTLYKFATLVKPKRGPSDLILPDDLHKQVMEIASFHRVWGTVTEDWGFGRLMTGKCGLRALFAGPSGTGKTLAAEVIAGELDMSLLRVDLARILSKWVGETEQHLESMFREAEGSHAVLYFDEADSLYGKRGEIQHGVDRFANLEVSYLLQRIEDFEGIIILSSNLTENIDEAFKRRFQFLLRFPRPEQAERRKIWDIAFPIRSALDPTIDLDQLSKIEMTGAAIVDSARTAALFAAERGQKSIALDQLSEAISRTFRREDRMFVFPQSPSSIPRHARR
jgi:hypothetical protein